MILPIYQVDAFTDRVFDGNPAAVCPLDTWLSERHMQFIAAENNLSETAFFVPEEDEFRLRWFTPRWRSTCAAMPPWRRRPSSIANWAMTDPRSASAR